jgi:large subunit ribosomal protein L25
MEVGKLNVQKRANRGSSQSGKLRRAGKIPGICYGKGADPILVSLDPVELMKALDPQKRTNTVIAMTIDGDGQKETLNVMLRDWQRDVLRGDVTHADFIRVDLTKDVHAVVPIILVGKPEGVKLGGTLHQVFRTLEIACTPDKIPVQLEVNVDALGMGDALHVRDLKLAAGIKPLIDAGQTICTVTAPRVEKVETVAAEGAAVEGAAPAEGAAAAPAAGAAAPAAGDKGAAAKPAAGGDKGAKPAAGGGEKKGK